MYQCQLKTTILAKICNSNPSGMQVCEQINACSKVAKSQADKHSKTLAPLYAGQPVATYDALQTIWVPATVICILPWNSYLVCTSNGSTYCHTWRHLHEHSVKAANTVPSGTTVTLQALSSHHFLVAQPASPPPCTMHAAHICCTCNTSNPDEPGSSCPHHASCSEECPGTKVCDIPCHTCAAMKIKPCLHGTKMPDPGDLGTVDPDCPWTLIAMCHCPYPQQIIVIKLPYHNLRKGDVI